MNNKRVDTSNDEAVFEVLGQKIKLKKQESLEGIGPSDIVGYVQTEAFKIMSQAPQLNPSQVAVLVALQLAGEKLALEKEYRENIQQLRQSAIEALHCIEEVTPAIS